MNLYMKKAEHYHKPSKRVSSSLGIHPSASDYGSSGPVQVSFLKYVSKVAEIWLPALESLGIAKNDHSLAGHNIGVSQQPASINPTNTTRSYSATAYLFPNSARRNLVVLTSALVQRINWSSSKSGGKVLASGVSFTSGGNEYTVLAKKEVIISAGVVNTPQILELSGVGSEAVLNKAGVDLIVDLPSVVRTCHIYQSKHVGLVHIYLSLFRERIFRTTRRRVLLGSVVTTASPETLSTIMLHLPSSKQRFMPITQTTQPVFSTKPAPVLLICHFLPSLTTMLPKHS